MLISRWNSDDQRKGFAEARQTRRTRSTIRQPAPYLGQRYRFAYLPSLAALASLRLLPARTGRFRTGAVSFADPAFDAPPDNASGKPAVRQYVAGFSVRRCRKPPTKRARLPQSSASAATCICTNGHRAHAEDARSATHPLPALCHHGLLGDEYLQLKQQVARMAQTDNGNRHRRRQRRGDTAPLAQPALSIVAGPASWKAKTGC